MIPNGQVHNVVLVVYHSINEVREDRIRVPNIVTPACFEAQIRYLASTARMIPLQEYLDHVEQRKPVLEKSIVVTFDDGYKDNLTLASPVLQKHGVPATFFITTGYIGAGKMKWEDQLSCWIRRSREEVFTLDFPAGPVSFAIGSQKDKFKAINVLVKILGLLGQTERQQFLNEVGKQLKVNCEDQADVMLNWEDVRRLASTQGFSIGSHSVTHPHLTQISPEAVRFEVTHSREQIENEIGHPVTLFAYPYGDFNQEVISVLQRAGYASAGTIEYGRNGFRSDPFRLKRVLIHNQSGKYFKVGVALRASPIGEFLRKSYNRLKGMSTSY
jgi:peptidoglycan/xylan/chitin deacetylase (PgdA/CDA1 family)